MPAAVQIRPPTIRVQRPGPNRRFFASETCLCGRIPKRYPRRCAAHDRPSEEWKKSPASRQEVFATRSGKTPDSFIGVPEATCASISLERRFNTRKGPSLDGDCNWPVWLHRRLPYRVSGWSDPYVRYGHKVQRRPEWTFPWRCVSVRRLPPVSAGYEGGQIHHPVASEWESRIRSLCDPHDARGRC